MTRLLRVLTVVLMVGGMAILGNLSAQAQEATDLEVHLSSVGYLLVPYGRFDISITNRGAAPLQSASVTLRADRPMNPTQTPCVVDQPASTLTCQFGAVPVGATATASSVILFNMIYNPRGDRVHLTVSRDASTPVDPNPANDTAVGTCSWYPPVTPSQPSRLWC
jgi:hypothetical protein